MATKKKQHYVPKLYLRNFAPDPDRKLISLPTSSPNTLGGSTAMPAMLGTACRLFPACPEPGRGAGTRTE